MQSILALPELPKPPDVADAMAAALCCANSVERLVPEKR
jgi:Holliday junction resolvasome RuvABC endonuclease subunit